MWIDSPCVHCQQRITFEAPAVGYQFACPRCEGCLEVLAPAPPPPQVASTGETIAFTLLAFAGGLSGMFLLGKGFQYVTDSWEGAGPDSVEFSASFKQGFKEEHVRIHGLRCPGCGHRVRSYRDLHVDHRKTVKDGGGPWCSNAQIRCRYCNLRKGGNSSAWEYATGR